MVDSRTGTGNIQDKPGASCSARKLGGVGENKTKHLMRIYTKKIHETPERAPNSQSWNRLSNSNIGL